MALWTLIDIGVSNGSKKMNIIGKKTFLRAIEPEDLDILREIINDPEIEKTVSGWSFPISKIEQIRWYENIIGDKQSSRFIIETKETQEPIGMIYLSEIDWKNRDADTGIKLKRNAPKRQGYATDAVFALCEYAFNELQLNRISLKILENNNASIRLYEKCGAVCEGTKIKAIYKQGKYHNQFYYGITKDSFDKVKMSFGLE